MKSISIMVCIVGCIALGACDEQQTHKAPPPSGAGLFGRVISPQPGEELDEELVVSASSVAEEPLTEPTAEAEVVAQVEEDPISLAEAGAALGETVAELSELLKQANRVQAGLLKLKFTSGPEEEESP